MGKMTAMQLCNRGGQRGSRFSRKQPIPPTDKGLGPQLRPFDQTLSVFTVLRDHFMPKRKDEGVNY